MDFQKVLSFNSNNYLRCFGVDECRLHEFYAQKFKDDWLKIFQFNPGYARYIAPFADINLPSIDFTKFFLW